VIRLLARPNRQINGSIFEIPLTIGDRHHSRQSRRPIRQLQPQPL
jgi:hypothetical protein